MHAADKETLYKEAFGRSPDCRAKSDDPAVTRPLRLGSLKGCNPLVWHPRSIDLAKGILSDFDFKMVVDCYAGDAAWALANLQMSHPRPYIGMTMCPSHSAWLTKIVCSAIRESMATEGHQFCDNESLALMQVAFPGIMRRVENQEEDEEEEDVLDEEDGGEASSPSDAEGSPVERPIALEPAKASAKH